MHHRFFQYSSSCLKLVSLSFIVFVSVVQSLHAQKQLSAEEAFQLGQQKQDSSIYYYDQAYRISKSNGDTVFLLKSLNAWGQEKLRRGDFKDVRTLLGQQLDSIDYHQNFGREYYDVLKTYNYSLRALNAYLPVFQSVNKLIEINPKVHGKDDKEMVDLLMTKGLMLGNLGIRDEARENLQESLNLSIKLYGENSMETAEIYNNIGLVFRSMNDYDAAMLYYSKTYDIVNELQPENYYVLSIIKNNISRIYDQQGEPEKALKLVNEAIALNERSGQDNPSLLNNRGLILLSLKDYKGALKNYMEALSMRQESMPENHPQIAYSYELIGKVNLKLGKIDASEKSFLKALEILESGETQSWDLYFTYMGLGDVAMAKGVPEQAIKYYNKAIGYFFPSFEPEELWQNPDIQFAPYNYGGVVISEALIRKGDALLAMQTGDSGVATVERALACYMTALESFKKQINAATSEGIKFALSETGQDIYSGALNAAQKLYTQTGEKKYIEKAFEIIEANKAYVLYQNLHAIPASEKLLPDELRSKYAILAKKIENHKKNYIDLKKEGESVTDVRDSIISAEKELDELNILVRRKYPRYFNYKVNVSQTDLTGFQSLLSSNALAIQYYEGKEGYYVLAMSSVKADFKYLNKISPDQLVLENADLEHYKKAGYEAYDQLVKPLIDEFPGIEHLIIMPDGKLNEIPFEALLTREAGQTATFSTLPYLIRTHLVSYHFSASLITLNSQSIVEDTENRMLAYAPTFSKSSGPLLTSRSANDSALVMNLPLLPKAEKEATQVAVLYGTQAKTGGQATEADFKKYAPQAGIIHLASHAIIDHENPLYSKLVFSPGKDTVEDGLLHTYELYNMSLKADLVSLSACNTGVGKYYTGEGPMSLARGFMYAGAPNVMMSLWSVPDQSTSIIMQDFYAYLKQGYSKAEALHKAKLDYLESADAYTAAPYFWSGFVYIGNLPEELNTGRYIYVGGGVLLVFIAMFFIYVRRKRKAQL
ncbi:CHAT domain-containing protein [Fulvivirga sp. 29W222]|uniref:CHAT domain-containing protein n=1 Tax=Fulvivirga marina TaxID=2494733 RepID=A0A937FUF1_9BACT|nr:CHAT domain-containing tetratricopeptide repeat protein [Fulvivirga marina]MBL6446305.1 CHAT domain-containing protein [Fulvivirga marina]